VLLISTVSVMPVLPLATTIRSAPNSVAALMI